MHVVDCSDDDANPPFTTLVIEFNESGHAFDVYSRLLLVLNQQVVRDSRIEETRVIITISDFEEVVRLIFNAGLVDLSDLLRRWM